jgi:hypothetical protein
MNVQAGATGFRPQRNASGTASVGSPPRGITGDVNVAGLLVLLLGANFQVAVDLWDAQQRLPRAGAGRPLMRRRPPAHGGRLAGPMGERHTA